MKLKKVFDLCKKSDVCRLVDQTPGNRNTAQWMGDNFSLYLINDMPYLEERNIYSMFDVSEKKRNDFYFEHMIDGAPCCLDDTHQSERPIERLYVQIVHKNELLTPMKTSRGITLVPNKYLRPFDDQREAIECYERDGGRIIAVKIGMYLAAVIVGIAVDKDFLDQLEELLEESRYTLERNCINFDRETGEVRP